MKGEQEWEGKDDKLCSRLNQQEEHIFPLENHSRFYGVLSKSYKNYKLQGLSTIKCRDP